MHSHSHSGGSPTESSPKLVDLIAIVLGILMISCGIALASSPKLIISLLGQNLSSELRVSYEVVEFLELVDDPETETIEITVAEIGQKDTKFTALASPADARVSSTSGELLLNPGELIAISFQEGQELPSVEDRFRLPQLLWLGVIFIGLALVLAGRQGVASLLGLGASFLILVGFVAPAILSGGDPLLVSGIGAGLIGFFSIYLAHGFNLRTTIALTATLITVFLALLSAVVAVESTNLLGLGADVEALALQFGGVNLRGLLLGGIVIGTLGVLDDITTSQVATVFELQRAAPELSVRELFTRASNVGREHISALINTLVLAYAGSSFPLFLLVVANDQQPTWLLLSQELLAEEIVRTLVGSSALLLAVPIATFLASIAFSGPTRKLVAKISTG